ncbi:MAG: hypothetical protein EBV31_09550 [Verrucomicrobia bacterium]|nr:hypothetical protein [Verrucomicrobiota bacterium]
MRNWPLIMLCLGLVLSTQVSFGPAPKLTSNAYPESHFFRAPRISRFEILRDGRVLRSESVGQSESADGKTLRVAMGTTKLTHLDDSLRRPLVQDGALTFRIPVTFTIDGKPVGESTVLQPIADDTIHASFHLSRYGWYLHDPTDGRMDACLLDAMVTAVRARIEDGNRQTEIKRLHGTYPR